MSSTDAPAPYAPVPSSPGRPLGVGLVGAGMIGTLRARALQNLDETSLVGIAESDAERRAQLAKDHAGVELFDDLDTLLEHPRLDAVVLATPPATHEVLGLRVLDAGKPLLCEKPLATSVSACRRLVNAARDAGVSLATGFNLRYTRAALLARRLLDHGAIGELDHIRAFHGHPGGEEFTHDWIHDAEATGGGTLMDNGIHLIDLTRFFLGEVDEHAGFSSNHTWGFEGCEDNGFLLLRSKAGRVATLQASWTEWRGYGYRLEIYGTEGFLRFGYPPLYLIHGQRRHGRLKTRRHLFAGYQIAERLRGWEWGLIETLELDLAAWAEALRDGREPPISGRDGLEAVRLARSTAQDDPSSDRPTREDRR